LNAFQRTRAGLFVRKLLNDQAPNLASLLAWGTLNALLPLLLGVLSLAGLVLRDPARLEQINTAILSALPADVANVLAGVLEGMQQAAASAGIVALVLFLINGSSFFSNMASVFDLAYHVQGRNVLFERLIGLCMLAATTALLVMSTFAAGVVGLVNNLPGADPASPILSQVVGWSIAIVGIFCLFWLLYRFLPNVSQGWRDVVPGTLLSSILLLIVSQVFPIYLTLFPPNHAYALFGVFLVITFWLYLVGFVLVLGAELNAFLRQPALAVALAQARDETATGQSLAPVDWPRDRPSFGGRLIGLIGLLIAALLLRGETVRAKDERSVA
jgi:membrane protein